MILLVSIYFQISHLSVVNPVVPFYILSHFHVMWVFFALVCTKSLKKICGRLFIFYWLIAIYTWEMFIIFPVCGIHFEWNKLILLYAWLYLTIVDNY
jgi:hypothetical protein